MSDRPLLILCFSPDRIPGVSMILMLSRTGLGIWAHMNLNDRRDSTEDREGETESKRERERGQRGQRVQRVGAEREGEKYQSGECLYISLALNRHYFGGLQYQPSRSQALTLAKHPCWERYTTETKSSSGRKGLMWVSRSPCNDKLFMLI